MLRPRPAPPADVRPRAGSPRQKRSKTRGWSWAGIPGPSSATVTSAQWPLRCTLTRAGVPAGVWARTLASRLSIAWRSRIGSPTTTADPSRSLVNGTVRIGGGEIAGGLTGQPHEVNRLLLQRPSLIGASQQQKIVHQPRHARTFGLDPAHGVANRLGGRERALAIELGVAA